MPFGSLAMVTADDALLFKILQLNFVGFEKRLLNGKIISCLLDFWFQNQKYLPELSNAEKLHMFKWDHFHSSYTISPHSIWVLNQLMKFHGTNLYVYKNWLVHAKRACIWYFSTIKHQIFYLLFLCLTVLFSFEVSNFTTILCSIL